jgi:hypothetical protein
MKLIHVSLCAQHDGHGNSLTSIEIRDETTDRADVDNSPLGPDQQIMEVAHHTHRAKDIDVEHFLNGNDIGIDGRHRVSNTTITIF